LLLRHAEGRIRLIDRLADCFSDGRNQEQVEHTVVEMLVQRIDRLALGYEDLNDHEQLRSDPLLGLLSGRRKLQEPLAGKSTLNRLELTGRSSRYHKIGYSAERIDRLPCRIRSCSIWTPPTSRSTAISRVSVHRVVLQMSSAYPWKEPSIQSTDNILPEEHVFVFAAWRSMHARQLAPQRPQGTTG
jgi:Transposase DDE domain group 1